MDRIEKLKEFLAATPNDAFLMHALALEYVKINDDEMAKALFEKLLQQNEGYVGSYYHLGQLLERQGATENAVACYENGMQKAKEASEPLAYNELQAAYENLVS
jgi:Tfp pilus assembly protein PilF